MSTRLTFAKYTASLTDEQIFAAQHLLRKWGAGPTNTAMIVELAQLLQFRFRFEEDVKIHELPAL
jgi:hypothetical protein